MLEAAPRPVLQARLQQRLAGAGRFAEGPTWAEGHARAALRLAEELDDDTLRVGALSVLFAQLRFNLGDAVQPTLAERAYELASACGDREQLEACELRRWFTYSSGRSVPTRTARALLESRYEEERGRRTSAAARRRSFTWPSSSYGRVARTRPPTTPRSNKRDLRSIRGTHSPSSTFHIALIAAHRGELERAAELSACGRELAAKEGGIVPGLVAVAGVTDLWSGAPASAVVWFADAEERADAAEGPEPNFRWWRADYVEALLELGRIADAVVVLDAWDTDAVRVGRAWVLAQVTRCRGLVAAAGGNVEQAIATLENAVGEHEEVGDPFGRARALLALGVLGRRARQKRPAREAIEAALAGFEALGAAGWAEKARGELGRVGGRARVEGLTAAEQRVAALVAKGRTNREVAAALFLAEATVASHLSHVYAKLGVRSRTELAGKLHRF